MAGQMLIALAQPVVMSAVSKLAGEYLRAAAMRARDPVGSAGGFAGMPVALLLGPIIGRLTAGAAAGDRGRRGRAGGAVRWFGRCAAPARQRRGAGSQDGHGAALWGASRRCATLRALAFLGFGVFVALSTWLQTLLHPDRVSETTAGALLVAMIVAGVVGCAVLPALVAAAAPSAASCCPWWWSARSARFCSVTLDGSALASRSCS